MKQVEREIKCTGQLIVISELLVPHCPLFTVR